MAEYEAEQTFSLFSHSLQIYESATTCEPAVKASLESPAQGHFFLLPKSCVIAVSLPHLTIVFHSPLPFL